MKTLQIFCKIKFLTKFNLFWLEYNLLVLKVPLKPIHLSSQPKAIKYKYVILSAVSIHLINVM